MDTRHLAKCDRVEWTVLYEYRYGATGMWHGVHLREADEPYTLLKDARAKRARLEARTADSNDPLEYRNIEIYRRTVTISDWEHVEITKTDKALTDEDIQALADEAERGYDLSDLKKRS